MRGGALVKTRPCPSSSRTVLRSRSYLIRPMDLFDRTETSLRPGIHLLILRNVSSRQAITFGSEVGKRLVPVLAARRYLACEKFRTCRSHRRRCFSSSQGAPIRHQGYRIG